MSKMTWRVRYWLWKPGDLNSIFRSQEKVGGENWLYSKGVPTAVCTHMCLLLMHTHTHTAQNNNNHHNKARCGGLHAPPQHTGGHSSRIAESDVSLSWVNVRLPLKESVRALLCTTCKTKSYQINFRVFSSYLHTKKNTSSFWHISLCACVLHIHTHTHMHGA